MLPAILWVSRLYSSFIAMFYITISTHFSESHGGRIILKVGMSEMQNKDIFWHRASSAVWFTTSILSQRPRFPYFSLVMFIVVENVNCNHRIMVERLTVCLPRDITLEWNLSTVPDKCQVASNEWLEIDGGVVGRPFKISSSNLECRHFQALWLKYIYYDQ